MKTCLAWLGQLQSWQLKRLAFLTGVKSTGTKAELRAVLQNALEKSRLPYPSARVLSVDMGVKNLAFCLLNVHRKQQTPGATPGGNPGPESVAPVHLLDWKRLDLSSPTMRRTLDEANHRLPGAGDIPEKDLEAIPEQANIYTPSQLSKVAYNLASELIKYQPDIILIERQRFRSGGAPAIQEWTVRVNMLESMLWASFEAMKHGYGTVPVTFPDVVETSPSRVGSYWLAQDSDAPIAAADIPFQLQNAKSKDETASIVNSKRSLEKKDKIALARYWLRADSQDLTVSSKLHHIVAAFLPSADAPMSSTVKKRKGKRAADDMQGAEPRPLEEVPVRPGKLDDLADCLVQGVTFALWEQNRRGTLRYGADLNKVI
ncbi:mitochondrial resolvase Ydc2 [Delphinella strobiligena]|nr:mitochondrial resolvase Ydc2 [Delphinella strobiligena]